MQEQEQKMNAEKYINAHKWHNILTAVENMLHLQSTPMNPSVKVSG